MQTELKTQVALPMEAPLQPQERDLELVRMRALFENKWALWHRCKDFDEAVKDVFTARMLRLAVAHWKGQQLLL